MMPKRLAEAVQRPTMKFVATKAAEQLMRTELPHHPCRRAPMPCHHACCVSSRSWAGDWRRLDPRIDGLSGEIEALARQDQACSRLMTVPGIGADHFECMVAAIGTGDVFSKGRDFGAWLGLGAQADLDGRPHDPRQNLEARQSLPARSVRAAAWVVLVRIKNWERYGLKSADRSRQEAVAPQRARDRARQQACPHRLGGAG